MGNTHVKPHPRPRNKKQVHWKAAARPPPPGKPHLVSEAEATPDLVSIQWSKPASDGGSPIFGFLVEHRRTGSPHWVRATPLLVQATELTISGLEPGWRYQFRVSAENAVGISDPSELSEPITVTLQRSAITAPRFIEELQEKIALENEKAEFIVHFLGQPAPKVCWYKDAYEIFSSRRIRILTEPNRSILTIHQCSLSDEGEIKCTATNRAGHVSTKTKLTVEAPPSIRLPRQYEDGLLFEIGELIRLKVSVAGRPTPLVFWTHNGESIKNNDRYEMEYIDKASVLKISEARREDRGEYQIKTVNKLGEDTQSFLVTVTDKPSPPGKARVVMALGKSVTLSWSRPNDDGGCKVGNYIVEYYRLGWNVWLKAATSRQLTTILGDLIEGSEYKFRVKAESPYGVSDPSDESDVVFIPDPKRGIIQPPNRSRSQPREISQEPTTPVAARRKNKPRSHSSSRTEIETSPHQNHINELVTTNVPKRPERTKIKSPPMTPEVTRKNLEKEINKKIFEQSDRFSMARELAYGSPDLRAKKESNHLENHLSSSDKSRTPSPSMKSDSHKVYNVKIEMSPEKEHLDKPKPNSPGMLQKKLKTDANENITGSSEFMLVLYPGENQKGQDEFAFDDCDIPPPMSLSAPELSGEGPIFNPLRNSASSTELLYERAMMRLYQATEAEREEKQKSDGKRKVSIDIPKIQINSKDTEDIFGLERKNSGRRMSAGGGLNQMQITWAQRRHSLKNSSDLNENVFSKLHKFPQTAEEKRDYFIKRQSESEENDSEIIVKNKQPVKDEIKIKNQKSHDGEKWSDDYESSTDETESSDDERKEVINTFKADYADDEEEMTYHPGRVRTSISSDQEPFEILTVRKDPPSPDFMPKPILKKTEHDDNIPLQTVPVPIKSATIPTRTRALSPVPSRSPQRERSFSLTPQTLNSKPVTLDALFEQRTPPKPRQRSFSLLPQKDFLHKKAEKLEIKPKSPDSAGPKPFSMLTNIAEVAKITGITAASIVIPDNLLEKQKDAEEAKVVIDHYGDIVRNYGNRRQSNPQIYNDRNNSNKSPGPIQSSVQNNLQDSSDQDEQLNSFANMSLMDVYNTPTKRHPEIIRDESRRDSMSTSKPHVNREALNDGKSNIPNSKNFQSSAENVSNHSEFPIMLNDRSEHDWHKTNASNNAISKNTFTTQYNINDTLISTRHQEESRDDDYNKMNRSPLRKVSASPLRKTESSPLGKSDPSHQIDSMHKSGNHLLRKSEPSPMRSKGRKTSPSPLRKTDQSPMRAPGRKTSPSPLRKSTGKKVSASPLRKDATVYSNISIARNYRPMLREIMTQTSEDPFIYDSDFSRTSTPPFVHYQHEELTAKAEIQVRSFMDYVTDLAMFAVACWLYFFKNELYAIPVLLIMVYRQLQEEISKIIPEWIKRRFRRKK